MVRRWLPAVLLILLLTAGFYGRSVSYGLLLDDFNQRAELRDGGWSPRDLVEAAHLGAPNRRVGMWWQEQADLRFFRPVAFLVMRLEYVLGGWRPAVLHVGSLLLAAVGACLVMTLARASGLSPGWSLAGGVLFLLHPANFLAVRWLACQNEQMATAFILGGLLLYGRWAGWWSQAAGAGSAVPPVQVSAGGYTLSAALLCFALAMGCRESAIMVAVMVGAGDVAVGRRRWRGHLMAWIGLAVLIAGYLAARHAMLGPIEIPRRPYAFPTDEPGFARFVFDKFAYYLLGLFACVPIIGFAGIRALREQPAVFYGGFAIIVLLWVTVLAKSRSRRILCLWLAVAIAPLAPVLPVFASSHHLYLPSAGAVLAVITVAAGVAAWAQDRANRAARLSAAAVRLVMALAVLLFAGAQALLDGGVAAFHAASQMTVENVVERSTGLEPGDRLYFINLPMLAFNCVPAIEERTGVRPLTGVALTFAPGFLGMDAPGRAWAADDHTLHVALEEPGYFSGLIGENLLAGAGRAQPFAPDETIVADGFTARIVRADAGGVYELAFTFEKSLADTSIRFYFGSREFHAYPLRFEAWRK